MCVIARKPTTDPVVITCALTGGIHGKEADPALPDEARAQFGLRGREPGATPASPAAAHS